jgi:hypothetical protein
MPGAQCAPAALRVRIENTQVSHHRFAEHSGIPCANGFNGFLRALPGDRAFCHRYLRNRFRKRDASVEASGPHDFAVRLARVRLAQQAVHRIPTPNVRDDRETPLLSGTGRPERCW